MDFCAPDGALLTCGSYSNAHRYLGLTSYPGLSFMGNGRGDNTLTGYFAVLELANSTNGTLQSFAADFMQYDEGKTNAWNQGSLRFNSMVPVSSLQLNIARTNSDSFAITWPTNIPAFHLEFATNMLTSAWQPVTNSITIVGGRFSVSPDASPASRFYRLRKP